MAEPLFTLNKREHLPIIRRAYLNGELQMQGELTSRRCRYAGPCAIGVTMPEDIRVALDTAKCQGGTEIAQLNDWGYVLISDDPEWWVELQQHHDDVVQKRCDYAPIEALQSTAKFADMIFEGIVWC